MESFARILSLTIAIFPFATAGWAMNLDDTFHFITTLVVVSTPTGQSQGTGFYYQQLAPPEDPEKSGPQWRAIQNTWLVTNRHIVLPRIAGKETLPSAFAFHMRKIEGGALNWEPIVLDQAELLRRARFHANPEVDIAAIEVHDLLTGKLEGDAQYTQWYGVSRENFTGNNNITVQASDDVVVIGYPRAFYDEMNLYPIVKSGIIASRWGAHFNGKPHFIVDAKLFPGSSGSIVLSKPIDIIVKEGQLFHSKEKQFAFLGIYSGEPLKLDRPIELEDMIITQKTGFNVGVVWYAELVEEIVQEGQAYTPAP